MDMWVVGAAAAAGYIAKYVKNFSRDRDGLFEFSSGASKHEKPGAPSCPFRRLNRKKKLAEDTSKDERTSSHGRFSDMYKDVISEADAASTSDCSEKLRKFGDYEGCNLLYLSNLPSGYSTKENVRDGENGNQSTLDMGDEPSKPCAADTDSCYRSRRIRGSLRAKRLYGHFVKPLNSLESCVMAQLLNEQSKMEEYVLRVLPSPYSAMRPLLVTDGSKIISRSSNWFSKHIGTDDDRMNREENVHGIPPLPKIEILDLRRKMKSKTGKTQNERFSSFHKTDSGKHFRLQYGSHDGLLLFCIGVSVGIISSLMANRREVDKLKGLLKQTENLVQDLQEELEMKDSLTVKELANENYESQNASENYFHRETKTLFVAQNVENLTNNDSKESFNEKAEESSEAMSKIEAELEAELERLGLSINTSSLERRLSDLVELDPDFVADFAQGELRPDMFNRQASAQPESNHDASGTATTHSGNYAISPRELSLRLYEVIQSRLEDHILELETALQKSQRKVKLMESEHNNFRKELSGSEVGYSSGKESPTAEKYSNAMAEPLVMHLSGEALDAYNDAYEELTKIKESDEEDSPSWVYENNNRAVLHLFDQTINGNANGSLPHLTDNKEKTSKEMCVIQLKPSIENSSIEEFRYDGVSEDDNSDSNDEMEKQLIKQIVEKTKKGSPVVLNAQRVLFSLDENER